ncbi:MAG: hypothetical protein GXP60_03665 [Epsilonproteobacteria bacterium]|nr:hypothetical protein [Campylobacterota bacterium]
MTKNYILLIISILSFTGCFNNPSENFAEKLNGKWKLEGFYIGDSLLLDTFMTGKSENFETNTFIKSLVIRDKKGFRLENYINDSLVLKTYVDSVLIIDYEVASKKGIYKSYSLDIESQKIINFPAIDSCWIIIKDSSNYIVHRMANEINRSKILELSDKIFVFKKGEQNVRLKKVE